MGPARLIIEERASLVSAAVAWIADAIAADVAARGSCALALSGGATPRPVYERLADEPFRSRLPWESVQVFFGDERAVAPSDTASNYAMAMAALLGRVPIPRAAVHRMEAERTDRDAAARDYERLLPTQLDLLLLGMGADGHTASLFPGSPALDERSRRVQPVHGPAPPKERLTITPPVIAGARRVAVLVAGSDKAATVSRALGGPRRPRELPVQLALGGVWFVDRDAAAELEGAAA
jgi:6-phosphogluconolactonase